MDTLIKVRRKWLTSESTIGEMFFDNSTEIICYTLEDRLREVKIPSETCIPAGKYEVVFSYSNRFHKFLPLLLNVPGFVGVRIHAGNTAKDTDGCILLGFSKAENIVTNSRAAYSFFFAQIQGAMQNGKVYIDITNEALSDTREV